MTTRRVRHLFQRNGWFYLRLTFPKALRSAVGRNEFTVSLRTKDELAASTAAFAGALAFRKLCDTIRRMSSLTDHDVRALVRDFHAERMAQHQAPPLFSGLEQSDTREWNETLVDDLVHGLETAIADDNYTSPLDGTPRGEAASKVIASAERLADSKDLKLADIPDGQQAILVQGVARVLLDEHRRYLHQLNDRLTPYVSPDPFFSTSEPAHLTENSDVGILLGEAVDAYIGAKAGVSWASKTETEFRRLFRWVREFFDETTPLASITKEQVRRFRNDIIRVRLNGMPKTPFKDLLTDDTKRQVSRKTSAKHFHQLASAFKWWVAEGYLDASPAQGLTVDVPKDQKSSARDPFTSAELKALFSSPIFTACAGPLRRTEPGSKAIRDGYYWVPLIGALSGMRVPRQRP